MTKPVGTHGTVAGYGMGWLRDLPDFRDFTQANKLITPMLSKVKKVDVLGGKAKAPALPATVDLRPWCSPVEDQKSLGSCTAQAGVGVLEYYERRALGRHIDASRLFLYKASRQLLHWSGDTGSYLRTTMKALALFGAPPEEYWPYDPLLQAAMWDNDPPAFCYAFAQSYQALQYFRLDPPGTTAVALLSQIKTNLAGGLPPMFGFTVYQSMGQAATTGKIPLPVSAEKVAGGHAVVAVGYDDTITIKNTSVGAPTTTGALLIRNSWGTWGGNGGYLWMPYDYVLLGLTADWWCLVKAEYFDGNAF